MDKPICPDCKEEMFKGIVKVYDGKWWVGWFCKCRLSEEEIGKFSKEFQHVIDKHHKGIPDKY